MDSKQTYSLPDSADGEELFILLGDVRELTAGLPQGHPDDGSNIHWNNRLNPKGEVRGMPTEDLASS